MEKFENTAPRHITEEDVTLTFYRDIDSESFIVDRSGEYKNHLSETIALMNLAIKDGVMDDDETNSLLASLRKADNASELLKARQPLTEALAQSDVEYLHLISSNVTEGEDDFDEGE